MSNRLLAGAAVVLLLAVALYVNDREELSIVQDAEAVFTEAEKTFAKTMETASASGMRAALEGYATAAGLLNGLGGFAGWLGQPLRLRVMHRMAAAQELLREDPVAIVAGHEALLREVMFAAGPAEAEAAFKNAVEHRSTTSGLQVLTWTTRWQMPDRHVPGLRAQMWWPELEAVEVLRANSAMLSREFALLLAEGGGGPDHIVNKFNRRRADSWIPVPRDGWGMVQLESCCTVAAATCDLVRKIRGPGARFTVGTESREWIPGEVMCFDDSYVHEAEHLGDEDRYILLLDVQHPDLPAGWDGKKGSATLSLDGKKGSATLSLDGK
eukprot:gene9701-3437_t